MKRIGIFGCTADPFTLAHREIVKQALTQGLIDFVYICPTIVTWHRKDYKPWLDDALKLKVIEEMTDTDDFLHTAIYCEDLRLRQICSGNKFLTGKYVDEHRYIDTLLKIKSRYEIDQDAEIYPIIGPDEYANFTSWYAWDSIVQQSKALIVAVDEAGCGRDGKLVDFNKPEIPAVPLKIKKEFLEMSATKIREQFTSLENYIAVMKAKIETEQEELLLHTPIFNVTSGPETDSGLKPIKINAPDWVSIMVEKDGKFLVEKQFRYGANDFVEEFPCGMVEKDEDPLDAVVRELKEETGIDVLDRSVVVKLGQTNPNPAFMTNTMHYYYVNLARTKYRHVERKLDEHEDIELSWKDKDRFMFDLAYDAHACGKKQVPAIALAMVKLYENARNYPCGG